MNRRGSILVAVLLLASLLTVFVGVTSDRLVVATAATHNAGEDIAADVAVRGAVEYLFARSGGNFATLSSVASVTYPGITVGVVATNEATRVDLNLAPEALIVGVFRAAGVDAQQAERDARVIIDRRRDPKQKIDRRKPPLVEPAGPFEHIRDLDRLGAIPPAHLRAVAPYVTVTSLEQRVAVMVAPPVVVAALPGIDPSRVEAFLAERRTWTGRFETLMRRYGIVQDHVSKDGSKAVRLALTVRIGTHRMRGYEVVAAALPNDDEPYRILSWNGNVPPTGNVGP